MNRRVIGLDLSLTASAVACDAGWVQVIGKTDITKMPLPMRSAALSSLRTSLITTIGSPRLVVVEGLDSARRYGAVNERAWLWYEIVNRYVSWGVPVVEVQSQRGKIYATGSGQATKVDMIQSVRDHWPQFDINKPSGKPDDNKADGVVMMAIGRHLLDEPLAELPDNHTRVLKVLRSQLEPQQRRF